MADRITTAVLDTTTIDSLIEKSSFGTPGAQALRRRTSPAQAADLVVESFDDEPGAGFVPVGFNQLAAPLLADLDNPTSVETLLVLIRPIVARYCRVQLGGRELSYLTADDVTQEVCLAVLKALPGYQGRGGSFLYFVHTIASHKVADARRHVAQNRTEPMRELPDGPATANEPELHALHVDLGDRLNRLLDQLPRIQQEVLALRIGVGLSASETAEALGISAGSVRITQHRALTRLRKLVVRDDTF